LRAGQSGVELGEPWWGIAFGRSQLRVACYQAIVEIKEELSMLFITLMSSLACGSGFVGIEKDNFRKIQPTVVLTGVDSQQSREAFVRCDSTDAWQATWKAHRSEGFETSCMDVDFQSHMVVAVYSPSSRISIVDVSENESSVRIRYRPYGNQIIFIPDADGKNVKVYQAGRGELDLSKPSLLSYAFIVIPKRNKVIVIEEDVRRLISGPAIWKDKAKLPVKR
jgi:hypothetical protein